MNRRNRTTVILVAAFASALITAHAQRAAPPVAEPRNIQERKLAATKAQERLNQAWEDFMEKSARGELIPNPLLRFIQPRILSSEQLTSLYSPNAAALKEPEVIRSQGTVLKATLTVIKAKNVIGSDPVELRSYNGKLVGPTLRCKPGDTLFITVDNQLAPEPYITGEMNTLHAFNTTNLHTHGLHVSPSGNSDNVLLLVPPQSAQRYEIAIPPNHPCGTFWYHAHAHGSTAANVGSGMAGALIIEGDMDNVPEIAKATDRVLMLQQIPYINNSSKTVCGDAIPPDKDLATGVIEAEYADCSFSPGNWDKLGRFTTINGQKMPVIKMRPGSVERWRFVDAALREVIQPSIKLQERSSSTAPDSLPMYEIAVDGLPLGRLAKRDQLELWPGYRSDVLVQVPTGAAGAKYILYDNRPLPEDMGGVNSPVISEQDNRHYLALIVIEGDPTPMPLPDAAALVKFRPESIDPKTVTGQEVAAYGIIPKGEGVVFTVDRTPFGGDEARQLWVGEVHEWTLTSRNNVWSGNNHISISHPFHIHVNPFEIFSILDSAGNERLDIDPATGKAIPLWRDTIILNEGWKVSARTRYTDFDGVFVQHCHILDHEDQGMMELVEINKVPPAKVTTAASIERPLRPYDAPAWTLPDATGKQTSLTSLVSGPTVLLFFEGFACLRCNEQIQSLIALYESFQRQGVQIIGISTDTVAGLAEALAGTPCPFPLVADPEKSVFRKYGCFSGGPLHGTFIVDGQATVRWQVIGSKPYEGYDRVLQEASQLTKRSTTASAISR